jgi:hypothetical protein
MGEQFKYVAARSNNQGEKNLPRLPRYNTIDPKAARHESLELQDGTEAGLKALNGSETFFSQLCWKAWIKRAIFWRRIETLGIHGAMYSSPLLY